MSFDGHNRQWKCGTGGAVNLQKVSSIVRDFGEPCLRQSPIKIVIPMTKMLKPDKWQAIFDSDGKIFGFEKVLKLIVLGGVDPSIRAEVWEFLLGCYALSSSAEYRKQLRTARRERYNDLVKQCQLMHPSIGTGSLAYVVGSKVMDVRTSSRDDPTRDTETKNEQISEANSHRVEDNSVLGDKCTDISCIVRSSDSNDLAIVQECTVGGACDCSIHPPSADPDNSSSPTEREVPESKDVAENHLEFPVLPVMDLFDNSDKDRKKVRVKESQFSAECRLRYLDAHMHSFEINNNADLIVESNNPPSAYICPYDHANGETSHLDSHNSQSQSNNSDCEAELLKSIQISDAKDAFSTHAMTSQGPVSEDKVSDWLWTLHRIVVDVVRTDSHLEFYEDPKNLARMSDILAVYAWVDPETGYCQGMSDLLSPFVVLFEDNADAFWCFEMLLRRIRENFKMDGLTGIMKQLQALWHILELTDKEMFSHLSIIGAESLHFAFRMLLVLFRRELSFNEALCMWEMIWAADFDVSLAYLLDENCPDILAIQLHKEPEVESEEETISSQSGALKGAFPSKHGSVERSISDNTGMRSTSARPFCGLTKTFWSKIDRLQLYKTVTSKRNGDDELPVYCVAAILVMNRQKIIRETHSIDDLIKIFNDNMLKIRVKRCVHTAIKLRKKYFYKAVKHSSSAAHRGS